MALLDEEIPMPGYAPSRKSRVQDVCSWTHLARLIVLAAAVGSVTARAEALTEQQAIQRALARPGVAEVERQHLSAADSAVAEAGRWPNPVLSLDRDQTRATGTETTETVWKLSQTLDLSGKRALAAQGAERRRDATVAEQGLARQDMTVRVRQTFAEALAQEQNLKVMSAWRSRLADTGKTVTRLATSGEVSGYDKRRLDRELQTARATYLQTDAGLMRTRHQLANLVAADDPAATRVIGELLPAPAQDLDSLLARLPARADLRLLSAQSEALASEGKAAGRGWAPDVTVGIGQKEIDTVTGTEKGLALSFAVPLPLLDRGQPQAARLHALAKAASAEKRLRLSAAEADVKGTWHQLQALRDAAIAFRASALAESRTLSRIAEKAYRAGEAGVLELLDAYRAELDAERMIIDLELRARLVRIELDSLAGAAP